MNTRTRRPLTPEEIEESNRLRAAYTIRRHQAKDRGETLTQEQVGSLCGWKSPQSTFNQYLSGKIALNLDALMRLSKVLDFSPERISPRLAQNVQHLASGHNPDAEVEPGPPITSAPRRIEIVGTAQLGSDGYWVSLDSSDGWVESWSRDEDAYALRLKGDSMAPAIRSGWIAVCEPNHRRVPGEYVMVTTKDGQSMVKELLFENDEGVNLVSLNAAYGDRRTIPWDDIDKIHYVGNILAPSKVLGRI